MNPRQEHRPEVKAARHRRQAELQAETDAAVAHRCPVCGADPGKPCESLDGTPHATRVDR